MFLNRDTKHWLFSLNPGQVRKQTPLEVGHIYGPKPETNAAMMDWETGKEQWLAVAVGAVVMVAAVALIIFLAR